MDGLSRHGLVIWHHRLTRIYADVVYENMWMDMAAMTGSSADQVSQLGFLVVRFPS